jgi:hypothetical protein
MLPKKYRMGKLNRIKIMEDEIGIYDYDWKLIDSYPLKNCTRIIFHAPKSYNKKLFPVFTFKKKYALEFDCNKKREVIYLLPDSELAEKSWNKWYQENGNSGLKPYSV